VSITEPTEEPLQPIEPGVAPESQSAAGKLFDLRLLVGGLFVLYGAVLIVAGAFASSAELHKAAGININLWMGIGMFVLGVLFLLWRQAQPTAAQAEPAPEMENPEGPVRLDDRVEGRRGA
jgi:hypothetical protein